MKTVWFEEKFYIFYFPFQLCLRKNFTFFIFNSIKMYKMKLNWNFSMPQISFVHWIYATSRSDDESSTSLYACNILEWLSELPFKFEFGDELSDILHFIEPPLRWSSCNFRSRSFSSRFCLRNLARRFLNQTCGNGKRRGKS